ncbi:hypothetical protein GYMC10_1385 [Paenibacillus sp. Y412MC10]|nr:hypothetical protein GYMC10_1385 [Paenibacillus sp. Y412MC10]
MIAFHGNPAFFCLQSEGGLIRDKFFVESLTFVNYY